MIRDTSRLTSLLQSVKQGILAGMPLALPSQARALTERLETANRELRDLKRQTKEDQQRFIQGVLHVISLRRSGLLWTPKKTGTTYLLNLYMNYLNHLLHEREVPVERGLLMSVHSVEHEILKGRIGQSVERSQVHHGVSLPLEFLVHTHITPTLARFHRTICLTRHPLDVVVSRFHWFGKSRGTERTMEEVIRSSIPAFVETYRAQERLCSTNPEGARMYDYQRLVIQPKETLSDVLTFLGYPVAEESLSIAVRNSSQQAVKRLEEKTSRPLVAGVNFEGTSFIRSGKVGEWRESLSPRQADLAFALIRQAGVSPEEAWPDQTT